MEAISTWPSSKNRLKPAQRELTEYQGTSTIYLQRRFVYGPGLDEPLAAIDAGNTRTYQFADALGSVIGLANASGQLTEKYAYTAYGTGVVTGPGTAAYRYAGRRFDAETGLYHNRARAYSAALGRFLQSDPIGIQGGINLYAYAGNDPINGTDPSGNASVNNDGTVARFSGLSSYNPCYFGASYCSGAANPSSLLENLALTATAIGPAAALSRGVADYALSRLTLAQGTRDLSGAAIEGASSLYDTSITRAGSQYLNVQTNVGAQEFQSNLVSNGYNVLNQTPGATILNNGTNTFTIYTRTSTGLPDAQFFGGNGSIIKYSLGDP